jgi:hypothetical protein
MLINHNPLIPIQVYSLLDGQPLESLFVTLDDLASGQQLHLRRAEDEAVQRDWNFLDLQAPVPHGVLLS